MKALSARHVAARMGRSLDWFYRNWRDYVRDYGFPSPIPGRGHPRWRADAVEAWIRGEGAGEPGEAGTSGTPAAASHERDLIARAVG